MLVKKFLTLQRVNLFLISEPEGNHCLICYLLELCLLLGLWRKSITYLSLGPITGIRGDLFSFMTDKSRLGACGFTMRPQ